MHLRGGFAMPLRPIRKGKGKGGKKGEEKMESDNEQHLRYFTEYTF